jgi:FkbM family methyltransferase
MAGGGAADTAAMPDLAAPVPVVPVPADLPLCDTPQGRYLICNPAETIQAALLRDGRFEPLASAIAIALLALRPGAVVDVGANIGVFSVPVARARPELAVLAVEPQRMVFMHLCANLLHNRLANVRPLNLAVGQGASGGGATVQVPFFDVFSERYTGSVSLDAAVQGIRGGIAGIAEPSRWAAAHDTVRLQPLDEIAAGLDVAFVKVDVEGMELAVLRSGEALLRARRPSLFFETWQLPQFAAQRRELLLYVMGLGYNLLQVGGDCLAYAPGVLAPAAVLQALAGIGLGLPAQAA